MDRRTTSGDAATPAAAENPSLDPRSVLDGHFALPPLPAVVTRLLEAIHGGGASANDIAKLLATDVGLVAQILKIVNSAYYGLPSPIRDVRHAVAYLGLGEIERVTLAAAVMDSLAPDDAGEFELFWYHSFHTALTAKLLAKSYAPRIDTEELHVAALLHDVGKLVYLKFFPDHYRRIVSYCRPRGALPVEGEIEFGLPSHGKLGASLCQQWRLPAGVLQACLAHELHDLAQANDAGAELDSALVALSNLLSNLAATELNPELKGAIRTETLRALDCDEQRFLLLMAELYELKDEVARFLHGL